MQLHAITQGDMHQTHARNANNKMYEAGKKFIFSLKAFKAHFSLKMKFMQRTENQQEDRW